MQIRAESVLDQKSKTTKCAGPYGISSKHLQSRLYTCSTRHWFGLFITYYFQKEKVAFSNILYI